MLIQLPGQLKVNDEGTRVGNAWTSVHPDYR
jgi:hypothetical protein